MADSPSLRLKVMGYFLLMVFTAVCIMGILVTLFFSRIFRDYVVQEKRNFQNNMVKILTDELDVRGLSDQEWLEQFGQIYGDQGMYLTLNDEGGETLLKCSMDHEDSTMNCSETMVTTTYSIPLGKSEELLLSINHNPLEGLSDSQKKFLQNTYFILLISMVASLLLAMGASLYFSHSLAGPLILLSAYAQRLSHHDYRIVTDYEKGTKEIDELHLSIEHLARSLENQENSRLALTQNISHELRTPLTKIQSSLEAMIDGIYEPNESRLQLCLDEILRLGGLTAKLDDLNGYDLGNSQLHLQSVNLKDSVNSVLKLYEKEFHDRSIEVILSGTEETLTADRDKLKQIWINLIANSMKFMNHGGELTILIDKTTAFYQISFTDNGVGIDSRDLPNVFKRFYKGISSENKEGSGLGLSIVKEIVQLHKGRVTVESVQGKGTTILIQIPIY